MSIIDTGINDGHIRTEYEKGALGTDDFPKLLGMLEKSLEEGAGDHAAETISAMMRHIKYNLTGNYLFGLENYYRLVLALLAHTKNLNVPGLPNDDPYIPDLTTAAERQMEWDAAETRLIELADYICRMRKEQHAKGESLLIERIHRFIKENLGGDLSLARIAEWVYFNPSYLSRFYKQVTGH